MVIDEKDFKHRRNTDVLIIFKEEKPLSHDEVFEELHLEWILSEWDSKKQEWIKQRDTGVLDIYRYEENIYYNGDRFEPITTVKDRISYAFACLKDDALVEKTIKSKMPEISDIDITNNRATTKPFLQYWMKKYNFTLEDFLFNNKYIVVSDNAWKHKFYELDELGLIDWDKIEICSEVDVEDETN